MDCFETLVELDQSRYVPRRGVVDFLDYYSLSQPTTLAVISDAEESLVRDALDQAGILARFDRIYHAGNALERLSGDRMRKRLDVPMADYRVRAPLTIFIGDSPMDAEAATHHKVPFIRIPRSEDRAFSFAALIGGPSRYNSAEFSLRFLERYQRPEDGEGP